MKKISSLTIGLLILASVFVSAAAHTQAAGITVTSKQVSSQFPDGVYFELSAATAAPDFIKEIKLEVQVKGSARSSYTYLDFTPDSKVQGKFLLKTGGAQYKPPGMLLEYHFIITDNANRTLDTGKEEFLYMDNRFEWQKVSGGMVEVYYSGPTKTRADLVLKASTDTVTKMDEMLGFTLSRTIRVIGYNDYSQMTAAIPFVAKAASAELVTQGEAFYEYNVLLEFIGDPRADGVASHELTHMLVAEAVKNGLIDLPAWFNEGIAEYANVNPGYSHEALMNKAIAEGKLLPLRQLQNPPGKPDDILVMYGQGRSVLEFMINTYGEAKMKELFAAFQKGLKMDAALTQVYGFDIDGLDNSWRKSLGIKAQEIAPAAPTAPAPAPAQPAVAERSKGTNMTIIFGVLIPALVIIGLVAGIIMKRRRPAPPPQPASPPDSGQH